MYTCKIVFSSKHYSRSIISNNNSRKTNTFPNDKEIHEVLGFPPYYDFIYIDKSKTTESNCIYHTLPAAGATAATSPTTEYKRNYAKNIYMMNRWEWKPTCTLEKKHSHTCKGFMKTNIQKVSYFTGNHPQYGEKAQLPFSRQKKLHKNFFCTIKERKRIKLVLSPGHPLTLRQGEHYYSKSRSKEEDDESEIFGEYLRCSFSRLKR